MRKYNEHLVIKKLIDRITKTTAPINNSFKYYHYQVEQRSNNLLYTDVSIMDYETGEEKYSFSFDFMLKELCLTSYKDIEVRDTIIKAFKDYYYGYKFTVIDEALDNEINDLKNTLSLYTSDQEEYGILLKEIEDLKKERDNL